MGRLLAGIDEHRAAIATGRPPTIEGRLSADLEVPVSERVSRALSEDVAQRVWRRDPSLWGGPGVPEIENRLGWLTVAEQMLEQAPELQAFADQVRSEGFTDAVLLGMGGSSLGPEVIRQSFGDVPDGLRLQVLDSTHPDAVLAVQESVDLSKTIFIVSSKSGGTIETLSHYRHFKAMARAEQFVVVTDPGSPLEQLAKDDGLRRCFLNPPDIGGRYSVLSYFGLVPAALMGVSVDALLHGAQVAEQNCAHYDSSESNSGLWLGAAVGEMARQGRDKLTFLVSGAIESFGLWVEQLIAESTGKHGKGLVPAPGVSPDGPDRQPAQPELPDPYALGAEFFRWEFAIAVAGTYLEINPFDQPDVQAAKDKTNEVLATGKEPELEPEGSIEELLAQANEDDYVCVQAFVDPDVDLGPLVDRLRRETDCVVTHGYGPRYMHSTGQLHKGGPNTGLFLQVVDDQGDELPIPGKPFGFRRLIRAQAMGDLETLKERGRRVARVRLEDL
jgi:glucose-6-phosphate isomerase